MDSEFLLQHLRLKWEQRWWNKLQPKVIFIGLFRAKMCADSMLSTLRSFTLLSMKLYQMLYKICVTDEPCEFIIGMPKITSLRMKQPKIQFFAQSLHLQPCMPLDTMDTWKRENWKQRPLVLCLQILTPCALSILTILVPSPASAILEFEGLILKKDLFLQLNQ